MTRIGASLRPIEFPSLVGLIEHPDEGPILFDTGYDQSFFEATEPLPERLYRIATPVEFAPEQGATAWLARRGLRPGDIRAIVLSHLHGDHVAGMRNFPKARIFASREGYEAMRASSRFGRVRKGLLDALLPNDFGERATWFEDAAASPLPRAYQPFDLGRDLFGDGSLIAIPLPGHCAGHWGLATRLRDGRYALLAADAAWSVEGIRANEPPPRLTTSLLGDTTTYRDTFSRLNALSVENTEMLIIPSHCRIAAAEAGILDDA